MTSARRSLAAGAASLGAGALVALALPPWGWWPLAVAGFAVLDRLLAHRPWRSRLARGFLFGVGWLAPGMGWMWFLTAPGYVFAAALYGLFLGTAAAVAPGRSLALARPSGRHHAGRGRALRVPLRGRAPGVRLAIGQAAGPLAPLARHRRGAAAHLVTVGLGVAVSAALRRRWVPVSVLGGATAVLLLAAALAPQGHQVDTIRVALVQGGGPQGTRAVDTDPREVVERHLAATRTLEGPVDLVVWPENVIDVDEFATSVERDEVAAEAARLDAPIAVGITEDAGDHFLNAQVLVLPDGTISSRYEKERRVPFGEYVPLRGLLEALGAADGPGRRATPSPATGPRCWRDRSARSASSSRGRSSSATGPATASATAAGSPQPHQRLQLHRHHPADPAGRLVPVARPRDRPLGGPGRAHRLHRLRHPRRRGARPHRHQRGRPCASREVGLREGRTVYLRFGDWPVILLAAAMLVASIVLERREVRPEGAAVRCTGRTAATDDSHVEAAR